VPFINNLSVVGCFLPGGASLLYKVDKNRANRCVQDSEILYFYLYNKATNQDSKIAKIVHIYAGVDS